MNVALDVKRTICNSVEQHCDVHSLKAGSVVGVETVSTSLRAKITLLIGATQLSTGPLKGIMFDYVSAIGNITFREEANFPCIKVVKARDNQMPRLVRVSTISPRQICPLLKVTALLRWMARETCESGPAIKFLSDGSAAEFHEIYMRKFYTLPLLEFYESD